MRDRFLKVLFPLAIALVLIGAVMRIMHWPYGLQVLILGFVLGSVLQTIEIQKLKKELKEIKGS